MCLLMCTRLISDSSAQLLVALCPARLNLVLYCIRHLQTAALTVSGHGPCNHTVDVLLEHS